MAGVTIDLLSDQAARVVDRVAAIRKRSPEEVVSEAFRIYLWVLHEQFKTRRVVSMNGGPPRELENLVEDKKEAEQYFKEIGWL